MTNVSEFGALNWVKNELDETVRKTRRTLEDYVEGGEDVAQLDLCADLLHQIAGVLQVVQVYGPSMLAEEMELVARAMADGHIGQMQDAAEALMLALIQLPDYLEKLQAGNADVPLIILPLLNDLRAVREAPLLSEAALFRPEINDAPVSVRLSGEPNQHLPSLVRHLRQKFHVGLLEWFRQKQVEKGWQQLLEVFDELAVNAGTAQFYRLVWVSSALMHGLLDHSITSGIAIKQLFSKVDRQLKRIIDEGETKLNDAEAEDLLKNLLYYIAQAETINPEIKNIKEAFNLDNLLPSEAELTRGRQGLSGSNAELAASISDAVQKELTRVKDVLDLFMRKQDADLSMLEHLEKPMRQLADTLGMIGQGALRSRLLRQANKVQNFLDEDTPPEEYELMEMAGDILFVESSLSTLHTIQSSETIDSIDDAKWGVGLPESEYNNLIKQTVREAKVDIAKAKEIIISFTESPSDSDSLKKIYEAFLRVYGALKVLELNDTAQILYKTADFIKSYIISDKLLSDHQQLNSLADVISSIEYYLEALVDGAGNRNEITAIAQSALNELIKSRPDNDVKKDTTEDKLFKDSMSHNSQGIETSQLDSEMLSETEDGLDQDIVNEVENVNVMPIPASEKPPLEDIDAEILEIFVEEAREELESIQGDLLAWIKNNDDKNALISFRRSFHTLKGSGRLVGAKVIGDLAWAVENMLNRVIDETIRPSTEMRELLGEVLNMLPVLIDCQEKNVVPSIDVNNIMQRASAIADERILDEMDSQNSAVIKLQQPVVHSDSFVHLEPSKSESDFNINQPPADSVDKNSLEDDVFEKDISLSEFSGEIDSASEHQTNSQQEFSDSDFMIELDTELLDVFAEETQSHLVDLEKFIISAKSATPRPQISDEIVRSFHTLHGSARMTGITPIAHLSKSVEEYLKLCIRKNNPADDDVLDLLEGSIFSINKYIETISAEEMPEPDADSYLARLVAAKEKLLDEGTTTQAVMSEERLASETAGELEEEQATKFSVVEQSIKQSGVLELDSPYTPKDEKIFSVDEDPELVEIFQEEARELLGGISTNYQTWLSEKNNNAYLEVIQRGLHTLKGSARLAGVMPIGDLAYALEKMFGMSVEVLSQASASLFDIIQQSLATLSHQINEIELDGTVHWADTKINALDACFESLAKSTLDDAVLGDDYALNKTQDSQSVNFDISDIPAVDEADQEDLSEFYEEPFSFISEEELFSAGEDSEILEIFFDESRGLLKDLKANIEELDFHTDNSERITEIQRRLHKLTGNARLADLIPISDLSQALEALFRGLLEERSGIEVPVMEVIQQSIDMLNTQVNEAESLGKIHRANELLENIEFYIKTTETLTVEVESGVSILDTNEVIEETSQDHQFESISYLHGDVLIEVGEDPELLEVFCEEAKEILDQLESAYQSWTANQKDLSLLGDVQRSLHTLKGSARLSGVEPVGDLSHAVESILTWIVNDSVKMNDSLLALTRQAMDRLASQIDDVSSIGKVPLADDLIDQLERSMIPATEEQTSEAATKAPKKEKRSKKKKNLDDSQTESAVVLPFVSEFVKHVEKDKASSTKTPHKATKDQVRLSADLMDRLVNNAGEVSIYRARLEQQNNVLGFNLSELEQTVSRLHTQLRNLELETETQILYRWERDSDKQDHSKAEFDPLELDRFSKMQQLSRGLMETVNDLGSINESLTDLQRETDTLLLQQSRISTDLQDGLLRTRMVPFAQLIPRMQRLVRQTADQLGKKAHLESFGVEGELDRNILNRMIPVLEHLLRNAVSHGIEAPADREIAGKEQVGRISLYIERESTNVLLTLSDDGRGLDIGAIRDQAIKQGIINQTAEVSDDDLIQCVLNPGFSTAKEVTQIAGRGVGLDVVASEIKQLGGGLEIDSQPGRGTSFTIRLPLTLAISDALLVRVGEEVYAVPHGSVEGVVRIRQQELQACYAGEQDYYTYANRQYNTSYLGRMIGLDKDELSESVRWFPLLLIHAGEHNVALQVDELLGTRQIVVKSIGMQAGSVRWITGGTILADGRVALILDVGALVRMDAARLPSVKPIPAIAQQSIKERIRVMVVDDSITVRKVTTRLLARHDMDVMTAKDGVEAVALLQEQVPDIMLLDIEMPRMDGFELARHINNSVDYYGLPIIMISSRVGEKHRQRAFKLGVKRCLGKPYQEAELLDNIKQVLAEIRP